MACDCVSISGGGFSTEGSMDGYDASGYSTDQIQSPFCFKCATFWLIVAFALLLGLGLSGRR